MIRQRVARAGQGKSGGYRMIVLYRSPARAIFAYGFAKSRKQDLDPDELDAYRDLAKAYLALAERAMDNYVADGVLSEVAYDEQKDQDR